MHLPDIYPSILPRRQGIPARIMMNQLPRPRVSVVAPCYNEALGLPEFHRRVSAAAREVCGAEHEIVLVDDGSRDNTWEVISALAEADPRVVGVRLMRNHGHQLAVTA